MTDPRRTVLAVSLALAMMTFGLLSTSLTPGAVRADTDGELWFQANAKVEVTKRFDIQLEQHLRLADTMSKLDRLLTELEPSYRLAPWVQVEGGYRFIYKRDNDDDFRVWHRLTIGPRFELELDPIEIDLRLRYQEEMGYEGKNEFEHTIRTRLRGQYKLESGLSFSTSFEVWNRIADPEGDAFQKWRSLSGAEYEAGAHGVQLLAGYERLFNGASAKIIVELSYTLTL